MRTHLVQKHKRQDLMGAGKDVFTHFAVRVERRKDEGGEGAHRKKDDEEIEEVPMERVKRLSTVLGKPLDPDGGTRLSISERVAGALPGQNSWKRLFV